MSLEGMWAVYFGDVDGEQVNSGIAVLETGRIFGGDSLMAYLGSYEPTKGGVTGKARIWAFNQTLEVQTAFGKMGTPEGEHITLNANFNDAGELVGSLSEDSNPSVLIPAKLIKVAELS